MPSSRPSFAWRAFSRALLATCTLICAPVVLGATRDWHFDVYLGDKRIGEHRFALAEDGEKRTLTSTARFDVKFLFINAYRYQHSAVEQWRNDCLLGLEASTDDNGTRYDVKARGDGAMIDVDSGRTKQHLQGCIMSFAYWNPAMLQSGQLLNAQNGEYVKVKVTVLGYEQIAVRGKTVAARHYEVRSEKMHIDLWYSTAHEWLALASTTPDGHRLEYRLR